MKLLLLFFCVMLFAARDSWSKVSPAPLSEATKQQLSERRAHIRGWVKICPDGSITDSECPFGDMAIFSGLLCLSGEKERCQAVKDSQSITGEWFRSPGMVDKQRSNGKATFSRDQSRGVLAYLVATGDRESAEKWMDFILANDNKLCKKTPVGWDACAIRPTWWLETTRVWDYLGLARRGKMRDSSFIFDTLYRPLEARFQKEDYPIHLTATGIYLRQEIAKRTGVRDANHRDMRRVLNIIHRRWPYNPFIHYLKFGATEEAAATVLKYCPATPPPALGENGERLGQWIWQRRRDDLFFDHHPTRRERSWDYPGGHDCVFMINLLLGGG